MVDPFGIEMGPRNKAEPVERAMRFLNEALAGKSLTDKESAAAMGGIGLARARKILAAIRSTLKGAEREPDSWPFRTRVMGIRRGAPTMEVAVAATLGAALSSLFEGSKIEHRMRDALDYVTSASPRPQKFESFDRKFFFVRRGGERSLPARAAELDTLAKAILNGQVVRFDYRKSGGEEQRRVRLQPLSLAIYDHQIYVVGRRLPEREVRQYRFSRTRKVELRPEHFEYPTESEYDPRALHRNSFGVFSQPNVKADVVEVRLRGFWAAGYAECHRWHASQENIPSGDTVLVRLTVAICPELKMWILGFGPDAIVEAPAQLREEIAQMTREAAARYAST